MDMDMYMYMYVYTSIFVPMYVCLYVPKASA